MGPVLSPANQNGVRQPFGAIFTDNIDISQLTGEHRCERSFFANIEAAAPVSCPEQSAAVPSRLISLQVADEAIEAILHGVMKQSFSTEERLRSRRMAALRKVMPCAAVATMIVRVLGRGNRCQYMVLGRFAQGLRSCCDSCGTSARYLDVCLQARSDFDIFLGV